MEVLGFWDFKAFNMALLAKQGWRLLTNPDAFWGRILKEVCCLSVFYECFLSGHQPEFHLAVFSAVDTPHGLSVKLNCDAAFKCSKAAFGIVVRDSTGYLRYVLGKPCYVISPLHAEIIAVHYACSLASDRGWSLPLNFPKLAFQLSNTTFV
ncbi:hypothetical protein Tco_0276741 [Tanacetum coccineum]